MAERILNTCELRNLILLEEEGEHLREGDHTRNTRSYSLNFWRRTGVMGWMGRKSVWWMRNLWSSQ